MMISSLSIRLQHDEMLSSAEIDLEGRCVTLLFLSAVVQPMDCLFLLEVTIDVEGASS